MKTCLQNSKHGDVIIWGGLHRPIEYTVRGHCDGVVMCVDQNGYVGNIFYTWIDNVVKIIKKPK